MVLKFLKYNSRTAIKHYRMSLAVSSTFHTFESPDKNLPTKIWSTSFMHSEGHHVQTTVNSQNSVNTRALVAHTFYHPRSKVGLISLGKILIKYYSVASSLHSCVTTLQLFVMISLLVDYTSCLIRVISHQLILRT